MNPYKVLNVKEDASSEEIRAAYLSLVKKYHPDKYSDNPLKELANEKIKEINEAYEILTKKGTSANARTKGYEDYGQYSGSGSSYSGPAASEFARARTYVQSGKLQDAKQILDKIQIRNAEWYFLYGIIYMRQGWHDKAREYLTRAYEQEPGNAEYRHAYAAVNQSGSPYGRYSGGGVNSQICTCCELCSILWCADMLCRCC